MSNDIFESGDAFESITIDREAGIVRGVKLLGLKSRNRRNYDTPGVRSSAPEKLTGAQIYIDHPPTAKAARSYRDKIGVVEGSIEHRPGAGHFGVIRYNTKHPLAEQFLWDLENAPNTLGMSINAEVNSGKVDRNGDTVIESIESIRSVDIVTKPATTRGMFESEDPENEEEVMDLKTLREKHPELLQQALEEEGRSVTEQKELETARKEAADLKKRLEAMEAEQARTKLVTAVTKEVTEAFGEVKVDEKIVTTLVECACEMKEETRKKLTGALAEMSPLMAGDEESDEETDEEETDEESAPAREQEEEDKKPARGFRPRREAKSKYDIYESLGLAKK